MLSFLISIGWFAHVVAVDLCRCSCGNSFWVRSFNDLLVNYLSLIMSVLHISLFEPLRPVYSQVSNRVDDALFLALRP